MNTSSSLRSDFKRETRSGERYATALLAAGDGVPIEASDERAKKVVNGAAMGDTMLGAASSIKTREDSAPRTLEDKRSGVQLAPGASATPKPVYRIAFNSILPGTSANLIAYSHTPQGQLIAVEPTDAKHPSVKAPRVDKPQRVKSRLGKAGPIKIGRLSSWMGF